MNVLVSLNRAYLKHFQVMLLSLSLCTESELCLYVLHEDLKDEDFCRLRAVFPEVDFNFITVSGDMCRGFPTVKRYPRLVYYRIFAPVLLPEKVCRALYLDCDLVLHNSIDEFYSSPFGENLFVACTHVGKALSALNRIRLGGGKNHVYINTGVVLMNVEKLRLTFDLGALRDFTIGNKHRLLLYDQDVLYRFYGDKIALADHLIYNLTDREVLKQNLFGERKIDGEWIEKNNAVVHYVGRNKPWKKNYRGTLGKYYEGYEKLLSARSAEAQIREALPASSADRHLLI